MIYRKFSYLCTWFEIWTKQSPYSIFQVMMRNVIFHNFWSMQIIKLANTFLIWHALTLAQWDNQIWKKLYLCACITNTFYSCGQAHDVVLLTCILYYTHFCRLGIISIYSICLSLMYIWSNKLLIRIIIYNIIIRR